VGLPHSEIRGSKVALTSPQLIAECHVLLRLLVPRHPPNALKTLASLNSLISIDQHQPRPETNGPQTTTSTNLYPKGHVQYHASDKDKVTWIPYRPRPTHQNTRQQPRTPTDNATDSTEPVLSLLQINHDKEQPRAPLPARAELEEASLQQDRGSGRGRRRERGAPGGPGKI
jgi:type IV secretory pathway VirB10-like protein